MIEKTTVNCFLCETDITDKEKVLSFHNFPDKLWDETTNNWDRDFRKLFNRALCSECATKDLAAVHEQYKLKNHIKEWEDKLKKATYEVTRYRKLFGRFYIKI